MSETFGALLRQIRQSRPGEATGNRFAPYRPCLSQARLAQLAEIDPAYINRLEMSRPCSRSDHPHVPSRAVVHSLARALECDQVTTDRLLIAAGYWPWPSEPDATDRALEAVHAGDR